jgi:hypothetical protein
MNLNDKSKHIVWCMLWRRHVKNMTEYTWPTNINQIHEIIRLGFAMSFLNWLPNHILCAGKETVLILSTVRQPLPQNYLLQMPKCLRDKCNCTESSHNFKREQKYFIWKPNFPSKNQYIKPGAINGHKSYTISLMGQSLSLWWLHHKHPEI